MSSTAVTALVITVHHLSLALATIFSLFVTFLTFFLFIRGLRHKALALLITVLLTFILGLNLAGKAFFRQAIEFEVVNAG